MTCDARTFHFVIEHDGIARLVWEHYGDHASHERPPGGHLSKDQEDQVDGQVMRHHDHLVLNFTIHERALAAGQGSQDRQHHLGSNIFCPIQRVPDPEEHISDNFKHADAKTSDDQPYKWLASNDVGLTGIVMKLRLQHVLSVPTIKISLSRLTTASGRQLHKMKQSRGVMKMQQVLQL